MSNFTKFVSIHPILEKNKWQTSNELTFYLDDSCKGKYITVPCGFLSDGASIPGFLCFLGTKVEPKTLAPAILHDYLWSIKYDFFESNKIFKDALRVSGVGFIKRNLYYIAVNVFGWIIYINK